MKKALLALAVAAATPAVALAQTNIQLYGSLDLSVESTNSAANGGKGGDLRLANGIWGGSRLGVKGSEDIGGGLKGIFNIEHRFNPNDGSGASLMWGGQAWVGLGGGFGEIRLGRQYTPIFDAIAPVDQTGYSWYRNAINGVGVLGLADSIRWDNMIRYATPSLGGVKVVLGYALNSATNAAGQYSSSDNKWGVAASGTIGPVGLGVGYRNSKVAAGTQKGIVAGAAGMIGQFGVGAAYGQDKLGTAKNTGIYVSAKGGYGSGNVYLAYSQYKLNPGTAAAATKTSGIGLTYAHGLSTRTFVYASLGMDLTKATGVSNSDKARNVAVGVRHFF